MGVESLGTLAWISNGKKWIIKKKGERFVWKLY